MPITNAFDRIDGDNIAYDALVDKRLYFGIHVGITQNMAYDNMLAALFLRVEHAAAIGLAGCNRLFKQQMGMSFNEYLNEKRLEYGKERLRRSKDSVLEISANAGFRNVTYFNRMFKRRYGISPTQYRRERVYN